MPMTATVRRSKKMATFLIEAENNITALHPAGRFRGRNIRQPKGARRSRRQVVGQSADRGLELHSGLTPIQEFTGRKSASPESGRLSRSRDGGSATKAAN